MPSSKRTFGDPCSRDEPMNPATQTEHSGNQMRNFLRHRAQQQKVHKLGPLHGLGTPTRIFDKIIYVLSTFANAN